VILAAVEQGGEEAAVSADGKWDMVIHTPVGKQHMQFDLSTDGAVLTGKATQHGAVSDITDGRVDGDTLTWKVAMTRPFKINLAFSVAVAGDGMTGSVRLGKLPSSALTGRRA